MQFFSGLTLAQSLRSHDIPFRIFDRDSSSSSREQGYAVVLHQYVHIASLFIPHRCMNYHVRLVPTLRNIAHKDAPPLESLGVSAGSGATDGFALYRASGEVILRGGADTYPNWIRANRQRLREWLCTGIDVQWHKRFTRCERSDEGTITAFFSDGSTETGDILVGADGVSSVGKF